MIMDTPNNGYNRDKVNLHERLRALEITVDEIKKNHLPHLQQSMDNMHTKFWGIIVLLIGNLVGLIFNLIK